MQQADQIFELGDQLTVLVRDTVSSPIVRLAVGLPDGLPKLAVQRLLQSVIQEPNLRLLCQEGDLKNLLADLALHRLDLVIADRAAPPNPNLKLYNHSLGSSRIVWYASASLYSAARRGFPRLAGEGPSAIADKPCCRHKLGSINGSITMLSSHASPGSSRTVRCSRHSAQPVWGCFRRSSWWRTSSRTVTRSGGWGLARQLRNTSSRLELKEGIASPGAANLVDASVSMALVRALSGCALNRSLTWSQDRARSHSWTSSRLRFDNGHMGMRSYLHEFVTPGASRSRPVFLTSILAMVVIFGVDLEVLVLKDGHKAFICFRYAP